MEERPRIETRLKPIKGIPDLTPLVDVLFLLLIFILLSNSFVQVSGINVELPKTADAGSQSVKKFVVTVNREGRIFFNDQPMDAAALESELNELRIRQRAKGEKGAAAIVIRADSAVPFGKVAEIMGLAERNQLNAVVATSPAAYQRVKIED